MCISFAHALVGIFEDAEVTHVMDCIDPVRELEIIQEELLMKDIAIVTAEVEKLEKVIHREKHRKSELVHTTFLPSADFSLYQCNRTRTEKQRSY